MLIEMLKAKIHRATVTDAHLDYEGSLSLCPDLMQAARLRPGEKVLVANLKNGNRFETYLITGKKGEVCINGAAAHLGRAGDLVIVICFALMEEGEADSFQPAIIHVNEKNEAVD